MCLKIIVISLYNTLIVPVIPPFSGLMPPFLSITACVPQNLYKNIYSRHRQKFVSFIVSNKIAFGISFHFEDIIGTTIMYMLEYFCKINLLYVLWFSLYGSPQTHSPSFIYFWKNCFTIFNPVAQLHLNIVLQSIYNQSVSHQTTKQLYFCCYWELLIFKSKLNLSEILLFSGLKSDALVIKHRLVLLSHSYCH